MAKKRPSDRQLKAIRTNHAKRAIRETVAYSIGWPDKQELLTASWHLLVITPGYAGWWPNWYRWLKLLGSRDMPRLDFTPFEDY